MKTILVTGGGGFIGQHLVQALLARGDHVIVIDDFSTGRQLEPHQNLSVLSGDISDGIHCGADEVYNLACPASPAYYQKEPVQVGKTCSLGVLRVLEWARDHGAKVLHASTSEIYGDPEVHPQPESYWGNVNPMGPRSCYDEGKRFAESLCWGFHFEHGMDIKIVRIFNTYGPGMQRDDGRVIPNFVTAALEGNPLVLHGDGGQTRSFCYVDDTVKALMFVMDYGVPMTPYNVGNPTEITVKDLASKVIGMTGDSEIQYAPARQDDPMQRRPDTSRISALGWQPTVSLDEGLSKTIDYFRSK